MNPTEIIARARTIILRLGLAAGGLVLVAELWRWLISPGGWQALKLDGFRISSLLADLWPTSFREIWIVDRFADWIVGLPAFLAIPVIALVVVALIYFAYTRVVVPLFHLLARIFALVTRYGTKQRRHIILCTDGTWNHPEELESGIIKSSNVYKFWDNLQGKRQRFVELTVGADLVKHHRCEDGTVQVSLYYPGVGNKASYSSLGVIVGGAFGFGAHNIRREAYRDIIRYYHPGDKITVVGFSRGAAIARMICSYVEQHGVPRLTISDTALGQFFVKLLRAVPGLERLVGKREVQVDFLGVWDTVASFGLAKNVLGIPFQRINLFSDFKVSRAVRRVVHLLAVDEQRDAFEPTPIAAPKPGSGPSDTILEEVWFPGVHSNVGGGFLNDGLARISLEYMTQRFQAHYAEDPEGVAVELDEERVDFGTPQENIKSPLRPSDGAIYEMVPRPIPDDATLHESVFHKMALSHDPEINPKGAASLAYTPPNVTALMDRLARRKQRDLDHLEGLHAEGLIGDGELQAASATLQAASRLRVARTRRS